MGRLLVQGPEGQREVRLATHNTLGRHPNNSIQILDRIVSKEHCHIDLVDGKWILRDLGSLNGTYVNGERVGERELHDGDQITMGSTRIVFQLDEEERAARSDAPGAAAGGTPAAGTASGGQGGEHAPARPAAGPVPGVRVPMHSGVLGAAARGQPMPDWSDQTAPRQRRASVTIAPGMVESHIRTKLAAAQEQSFLPERMITDERALRQDYERLRANYEMMRAIGVEFDVDRLLTKILDTAFQLVAADRGVVLLYDDDGELKPKCVRTRRPGAEEEVVLSSTIVNEVLRDKAAVLSSDASMDARFKGAHSIIMQGIRSTMAVPLLYKGEVFGILVMDSQIATGAFTEKDLQLLQSVANQAAIAIQNSLYARRLEREAVMRERFRRLLSPAIADQVLSGKVEVKKSGELRETTILFADIRGFTSMSESRSAREVVDMLNEYFERMVRIIFEFEGTLDKFIGDEIMAIFGAPVAHGDDPLRAVRAALAMQRELERFNAERADRGEPAVHVGVGINTGEVVAGYIGSSQALEYTVIGDPVNTGSRLCSLAKAGQILISEDTYRRVQDHVEVEAMPPTPVKGKSLPLRSYLVLGERG